MGYSSYVVKNKLKLAVFASVVGTVIFALGLDTFFNYTNTTEFCISCHSMESTVYQEYKKTPHYKNVNGARAGCPDCHVPRNYPDKLFAKIYAVKDIYHTILGSVDTKEKFEAKRLIMAQKVWVKMEETQSRECKNCHSFDAMIMEEQGRRGKKKHPGAIELGMHCISCHKGVAHKLPKGVKRNDVISYDGSPSRRKD
ncbi:MAG: NapC/NirT family cytochrome c [Rhodospirillales bacterium]|nr:NapC/NirT family cytochrome c [Rhodospirillales bacterium]